MKIGIFAPNLDPQAGGGFTFVDTIIKNINERKIEYQFFVFYFNKTSYSDTENVKFIKLENKKTKKASVEGRKIYDVLQKIPILKNIYFRINQQKEEIENYSQEFLNYKKENEHFRNTNNLLNTNAEKIGIDLMWYISPAYLPTIYPYMFTVWDLAHIEHPYFPEISYTGWTWYEREKLYSEVLRKATSVITGTKYLKNIIKDRYLVAEEHILVNPFPVNDFEKVENIKVEDLPKPYVFYPAQFWPHKNHICILQALNILKEKYGKKINIIFTGSDKGNKKYINQKVKDLDLENQIFDFGFVSEEKLKQLYKNAEVLVFASFFGPDNLPTIEALSLECPVIASQINGAEEQLKDAVLYFDPKNENDLAEKINFLLENSNLKDELIKKGEKLVSQYKSDYYVDNIMKEIENFSKVRKCWDSDEKYIHL